MSLFIHVGTGKTGTTHLQNSVFPSLCQTFGIEYNPPIFDRLIRLSAPRNYKEFLEFQRNLKSGEYAAYREEIYSYIESLSGDVLISNECFFSLGYQLNVDYPLSLLRYFFEQFVAIIFVRPHKQFLYSLYRQAIHQGNILSPHEFFRADKVDSKYAFNSWANGEKPCVDIGATLYVPLVERYRALPACKEIYIIDYDRFRENNAKILLSLFSDVFGVSRSESLINAISAALTKKGFSNVSLPESSIDFVLRVNSKIDLSRLILYNSTYPLVNEEDDARSLWLTVVLKLPRFINRLLTWRFFRRVLSTRMVSRLLPSPTLSDQVDTILADYDSVFERDWRAVLKPMQAESIN